MSQILVMWAEGEDSVGMKPQWMVEYTNEQQFTSSGKTNFANLLRLGVSIPVGRSFRADVSTLSTWMASRESIGNDLQTFSNLDADPIPLALSTLGVGWNINPRHDLFVGIRNMNEDYFVSPVTSLFTNSSCGIYPTISANFAIANYPFASVGAHYHFVRPLSRDADEDGDAVAIDASLYNGTGYNHFAGRENVFRFCPKSDGLFALAQAQYGRRGSRYFLGLSGHCGRRTLVDVDVNTQGNGAGISAPNSPSVRDTHTTRLGATLWTYAEQRVTADLTLTAAYSHAFLSDAVCTDFVGVGGRYAWRCCEFGLFSDYARFAEADEWATELTCRIQLATHFSLQPSAHLIRTGHTHMGAFSLRFGFSL